MARALLSRCTNRYTPHYQPRMCAADQIADALPVVIQGRAASCGTLAVLTAAPSHGTLVVSLVVFSDSSIDSAYRRETSLTSRYTCVVNTDA